MALKAFFTDRHSSGHVTLPTIGIGQLDERQRIGVFG
jgi:hypothetical protein